MTNINSSCCSLLPLNPITFDPYLFFHKYSNPKVEKQKTLCFEILDTHRQCLIWPTTCKWKTRLTCVKCFYKSHLSKYVKSIKVGKVYTIGRSLSSFFFFFGFVMQCLYYMNPKSYSQITFIIYDLESIPYVIYIER